MTSAVSGPDRQSASSHPFGEDEGVGLLERIVVPCLSRKQQMQFHRGYVPRTVDLHDLRVLEELASIP